MSMSLAIQGHPGRLVGLLSLLLMAGISFPVEADPVGPSAKDRQITRVVSTLLQRDHVTRHPLDDEISQRGVRTYLKSFDPMKVYFYQSDVDTFLKQENEVDDLIRQGDIHFGHEVFQTFLARVDERLAMVDELLAMEHDFTIDEEMVDDRDVAQYARNKAEARERWRKRIKYDLLTLKAEDEVEGAEAVKEISRRYHGFAKRMHQTDDDELLEMYLTSITMSFDPHTTYMSPNTLEDFDIQMRLNLEGIGAALVFEDGYTVISKIIPGGAADKDGRLKAQDKIVGVAQGVEGKFQDVVDMKLRDVVKLIRGKRGTMVRLQVIPAEDPKEAENAESVEAPEKVDVDDVQEKVVIEIVREKIDLVSYEAQSEIFEEGTHPSGRPYKLGVIDLPSFYMDMEAARLGLPNFKSTTRDVRKILQNFDEEGVDAVVLDLRRNGGGSLQEAINLTGLFIKGGPIVQIKKSNGHVLPYSDLDSGIVWEGPLVVLISKFSASASEILAGAIQDYHRGLIVGDHATHGKGTVQNLTDLTQKLYGDDTGRPLLGALKITIQQFYRPNGDSTQNRGVLADIELPSLTTHLDVGEADLDYPLAFDQVPPLTFDNFNYVNDTIRNQLRHLSMQRCAASKDFQKVTKNISRYQEFKERNFVTLNEEKFMAEREELNAEEEEKKQLDDINDPNKSGIHRNYYLDEALAITLDYLQVPATPSFPQAAR